MSTLPINRGNRSGSAFGIRMILLAITVAGVAMPAPGAVPEGVSPGAIDRIAAIRAECPTFSWGAVEGAAHYEIVVYELAVEADLDAELELSPDGEVLYTRVVGSATGWTPELDRCLAPGGRYVWFVRAVPDEDDASDSTDWSTGRFFSVAATPSAAEVEQALDVLRRYANQDGARTVELHQQASENRSSGSARSSAGRQAVGAPGIVKTVPTATAAIKGAIPDPAGETYGVVGISSSPDGAGVAAANTAGGPDLVLDGSEDLVADTELSESGIDRPSGSAQSFSFGNSGGGGMVLDIDGVEVVTTATDRDALGDLSCTGGELAKWNGNEWACDDDLDFDTLGGLLCGNGQLAKWNGSSWSCAPDENTLASLGCTTDQIAKYNGASWVCAPDNDTQYTVGPGIIVDGSEIRVDWAALQTSWSTLDSDGNVGGSSSIAIGTDGLGLISYYDTTNGDLKVAHCNDAACSSATATTLDSGGNVGRYSSIAIGTDGLGLISYWTVTNNDLKIAHCDDISCSSATVHTLDSGDDVGAYSSIAIGADGLGLISYRDSTFTRLKVAHCVNTECTSAAKYSVDNAGDVGVETSIAIGADGLGLISYWDFTNFTLKVAHCNDVNCSTATTATIDSSGDVGRFTSIAIGADGLGLISYQDAASAALKVAHCNTVFCSGATISSLDRSGLVGYDTSIAIGADGLGLISHYDATNGDLKIAHCSNAVCSDATHATVDHVGQVGLYTSIAIGADGLGLISYYDDTNDDLRAAHLGIGVP